VLNSVAEGMDPVEYWASSYGTRKGALSSKFSIREAGYFGKKLALALQRSVVTEDDCGTKNGILEDGSDAENIGTVLQIPVAGIPAGTIIHPDHLKKFGKSKVVVRSPITCEAETGLCGKCAGIRERGTFPEIGDHIGMSAALAFSERLSQTMLNVKHGGGAAGGGKGAHTYQDIERLFEMPQQNIKSAVVAHATGKITDIRDAPAGGVFIMIGNESHWAPSKEDVQVKQGQDIEAGDVLTAGIPNPKELAEHRGIGDARVEFVKQLRSIAGKGVNRHNAELLARGLIAHVKVMDNRGIDEFLPGDVVRYDDIARRYKARPDAEDTLVSSANGRYLEQPVLHYTIGTKLTNRSISDLKKIGIRSILTHRDPPGFESDVQRMYAHSQYDPDWMARLSGYGLEKGLLHGVHGGDVSTTPSTSFVPGLAKGVGFGDTVEETGEY
jgi:hypothetical protein